MYMIHPNDNFIVKNKQLEDRENDFKNEVFNMAGDMEDLEAFHNYWSEPDKGE